MAEGSLEDICPECLSEPCVCNNVTEAKRPSFSSARLKLAYMLQKEREKREESERREAERAKQALAKPEQKA